MPPISLPALPGVPSITVPEITVPGLNSAGCGLNSKIEEFNAAKDKAFAELKALVADTGGISSSISSLASKISSSVSDITESLNKNLLSDLPTVGLKLQDEFHSAINLFKTEALPEALSKLKEIQKQFPTFDMQKALDAAGGILPVGAIPPNAAELIKGDLTEVIQNLQSALPKIEKAAGALAANATSLLSDAQKTVSGALNSITSGSGITTELTSLTSSVGTALDGAKKELLKLGAGGSLSATEGEISGFLNKAKDAVSGFSENLTKGIAKIPAFDICTACPNQQVINGVVEEKAIPPIKPTENAEPPTPPTPAPKPVVPKQANKFAYPHWTRAIKTEIFDSVAPRDKNGERIGIAEKIPLDPNGFAILRKADATVQLAMLANFNLIDAKLDERIAGLTRDLLRANFLEVEDLIAAGLDIKDLRRVLAEDARFQRYRIENNFIDMLPDREFAIAKDKSADALRN